MQRKGWEKNGSPESLQKYAFLDRIGRGHFVAESLGNPVDLVQTHFVWRKNETRKMGKWPENPFLSHFRAIFPFSRSLSRNCPGEGKVRFLAIFVPMSRRRPKSVCTRSTAFQEWLFGLWTSSTGFLSIALRRFPCVFARSLPSNRQQIFHSLYS